jgi:peptidylprolyl isomerase
MTTQRKIITVIIVIALILGIIGLTNFTSISNFVSQTTNSNTSKERKVTLKNGLIVEENTETLGSGAEAISGKSILIHYKGTLTDGKKFDSSFDRKEPLKITIGKGQVIQGWDIGVAGLEADGLKPMKVGGKRKLTIPAELAYGKQGAGMIPPNATLVFELELMGVL